MKFLKDFPSSGDVNTKLFEGKAKLRISEDIQNLLHDQSLSINYFSLIGLLLMRCFVSFMMNFHNYQESLYYNIKIAAEKNITNQIPQKSLQINQNLINPDTIC